jgi:uncharacterized membrane protein
MKLKDQQQHYLILTGILLLGIGLRFWHLDLKALWLDEVTTALFSLGKNYQDIPVEKVLSLTEIHNFFQLKSGVSCSEIADNLTTQSTHPPLFFCLLHQWLHWLEPFSNSLSVAWRLRSFSAILGVMGIIVIYLLNRIAFSAYSGLIAATVMAVSPFAVYLSQEARHYMLPIVLITSSLLGLIKIYQSLQQGEIKVRFWLGWSLINAISLYVHYFCIFSLIAQGLILIVIVIKSQVKPDIILFLSLILPVILFMPWFPIFQSHFSSPDTSWLPKPNHIEPIYQTLITWILMIVFFPVESQPLLVQIISGSLMLLIGSWLFWQLIPKLKQLYRNDQSSLIIYWFILLVIFQILAIIYLFQKDLTVAPRYHFIYYPGFAAILGASLALFKNQKITIFIAILGVISSIFVVSDLAYQKPYQPNLVVNKIHENSPSTLMIITYDTNRNLALGLSYALALDNLVTDDANNYVSFIKLTHGYEDLWYKLSTISTSTQSLWILTSSLKQPDYLPKVYLGDGKTCILNPQQYDRLGFSYQGYDC